MTVHVNRTRKRGRKGKAYLRINSGPQRNKYVHTLIAEAMLGRSLKNGECVDHKDGNGLNPDWRNLRLRTIEGNSSRSEPPKMGEVIVDFEKFGEWLHDHGFWQFFSER